ncbi:MAG: FAD-dependent oxidoreductase [Ferruginibacter sp.]
MSKLERRDFIKKTVMGGIGATLLNGNASANITPEINEAAPEHRTTNPGPSKKIIVGGAGLAGLCCAYELMKKGHDVTVLEASGRHGGHIFTVHDGLSDGLYGDFGQEHIVKPGYKLYFEYAKELGLETIPYPRRKNVQRRIDGKFYSEEMLKDPAILKKFGFNEREVKFLSENAWGEFETLFTAPYLEKFTDEYQPFNIGYDDLDKTPASDFFKKEGASKAAQEFLGGEGESTLFKLWYGAILKLRGVPVFPTEIYRLKGGNQMLPNAFAKKLGARVWLSSPITFIKNGDTGVTVTYKSHNEEKQLSADYFVNCIPLTAFRNIPIQPAMSAEKQYVFDNITYDSYSRFVFQASSKFWLDDGLPNINLFLGHPDLGDVWHSADEVDTHRVIVLGTGPGGVSPQRALAAFREVYPGKKDTIELAISRDWTKETFSPTCERKPFPIGQLKKFWPHIIKPEGRIHFAGAYADNLNWGTEAATRSANRVANVIDKA